MKKQILILIITASCFTTNAQYTKLLDFDGTTYGNRPYGDLLSDGTFLYGMTQKGGTTPNDGVVFKIKPDGTGYLKMVDFAGTSNGAAPSGSLFSDGTYLYGMTEVGGSSGNGTLFKIMPDGTAFLKLFDFGGASTGANPTGSLITDGTLLYGMTFGGGLSSIGTIFRMLPGGGGYFKLLDFNGVGNGTNPYGSLFYDGTYLYAMAQQGGANGMGTIIKIMPNGSGYTKLLDFAGTSNGSYPGGTLISDGTFLYGMTQGGGANNDGAIFRIKPDGSGDTTLLNFAGSTNGRQPVGSLVAGKDFLYGMTAKGGVNDSGTVFKIRPDGTGYAKLYDFTGGADGSNPWGSLITDGTYAYGMTTGGGTYTKGVIFKLVICNATGSSITQTACDSIIINGQKFVATGTYAQHFTNEAGCDSTVTLNLTINTPTSSIITQAACDSLTINGQKFVATGTYTQHLSNAAGCDSAITLNLIINNSSSSSLTQTACNSITINAQTYTATGTYIQHFTNKAGCDSSITLHLTINDSTSSSLTQSACKSITINTQTYTTSGTYIQHLTNAAGCDSAITLHLSITTVDTSVTQNGTLLIANASGATYQWADCNNSYTIIPGQTNKSFIPSGNGSYAVIVTQSSCKDTSSCYNIIFTGIERLSNENEQLIVYPNPSTGQFTLQKNSEFKNAALQIFNTLGEKVYSAQIVSHTSCVVHQSFPSGIYFVQVRDDEKQYVQKIIVE